MAGGATVPVTFGNRKKVHQYIVCLLMTTVFKISQSCQAERIQEPTPCIAVGTSCAALLAHYGQRWTRGFSFKRDTKAFNLAGLYQAFITQDELNCVVRSWKFKFAVIQVCVLLFATVCSPVTGIDVDVIQRSTGFAGAVQCCFVQLTCGYEGINPTEPCIQLLWEVLKTFSDV